MPDAELLSGILKPCYVDGKLYSIVGAFAIDPLFGPAEKLGASLETSVEDVLLGAVPDVSFSGAARTCSAFTAAMRRSNIWTMTARRPPLRARSS